MLFPFGNGKAQPLKSGNLLCLRFPLFYKISRFVSEFGPFPAFPVNRKERFAEFFPPGLRPFRNVSQFALDEFQHKIPDFVPAHLGNFWLYYHFPHCSSAFIFQQHF